MPVLKSVTQWLDATAERLPDKVAFGEDKAGTLTFAQLRGASRATGTFLAKRGINKQPVLVALGKTPQCVAAMLGAAYANCPYTPLDVDMPPGRIRKVIDTLQPAACITDAKHEQLMLESGLAQDSILLYECVSNTPIDEDALADVHERRISTDLLYIPFTSGSTGAPKGVAVSNGNVIDYTPQAAEKFGFNDETVFGQSVPFVFDGSILYVYQTLLNGCTDWIISKVDLMFAAKTVDFLNRHRCNTVYMMPTLYSIIAKSGILNKSKPEYLQKCLFVGEVMPNSVLNIWRRALPKATFANLFGPTEATTFLCYVVDRDFTDEEPLPIGTPYENNEVLLLDENGTETKRGEVGEMCVRGAKVTQGYYNDPERSAAVFVQNPLNRAYRETIYRTGDFAYLNEQGEYMFMGRKDFQVKLAGHRIELGEVEVQAMAMPGVELCACVLDEEAQRLVLFYVGEAGQKELRDELKRKLQGYMVPAQITSIDAMPRTGSGKIDRIALKEAL
ncbi:MAG: amino acid adenylation domain-containing protein [Eggerthellaceae bacterium]|nr:amino acid adenylation domain-containing protein [Eggerthellaceae bacterium]